MGFVSGNMLWRISWRVHVLGKWRYIHKIQQRHSKNTSTTCLECFRKMCFDTNKENDTLLSREQDLGHNALCIERFVCRTRFDTNRGNDRVLGREQEQESRML